MGNGYWQEHADQAVVAMDVWLEDPPPDADLLQALTMLEVVFKTAYALRRHMWGRVLTLSGANMGYRLVKEQHANEGQTSSAQEGTQEEAAAQADDS